MALERDLLSRIDDLSRRLDALERYPQAPSIGFTTSWQTPVASLQAGSHWTTWFTLRSPTGFVVQGVPILDITNYDGTTISSYPEGSSWTSADIQDLSLEWFYSPSNDPTKNLSITVVLKNRGSKVYTGLAVSCVWRFSQAEGAVGTGL